MSDFGETRTLAGTKEHRCEWCDQKIPKGESHRQYKGMFEGEWQNWRMHTECYAVYAADGYGEFMPGDGERPVDALQRKGQQ